MTLKVVAVAFTNLKLERVTLAPIMYVKACMINSIYIAYFIVHVNRINDIHVHIILYVLCICTYTDSLLSVLVRMYTLLLESSPVLSTAAHRYLSLTLV